MKIALLGYGRMGKAIEEIAIDRGHEIVARISPSHKTLKDLSDLDRVDVAIDFSLPESAYENIGFCLELGIPVISGTTGWLDRYEEVVKKCEEQNASFLYSSNFSLGVNLFFELNKKLAELIGPFDQYKVRMTEVHHLQKLDAPSGTAISLAEQLIDKKLASNWTIDPKDQDIENLKIEVVREEGIPGTHEIKYDSEVDDIVIRHTAHNRKGFALGAVIASEWIQNKSGVFSMRDVLNL